MGIVQGPILPIELSGRHSNERLCPMLRFEQRACLVCDGRATMPLHRQSLVGPDKGCTYAGYDVVACCDCGFVYAAETLGQHELDDHYGGEAYKVGNEI